MKRIVAIVALALFFFILISPLSGQLKALGAILVLFSAGMALTYLGMEGSYGFVLLKSDVHKHIRISHAYKELAEDLVRATLILSFGVFYILAFLKHPRKLRILAFYLFMAIGIGVLTFSALSQFLGGSPNFLAIGVLTVLGHGTVTLISLIANSALIIYTLISGGSPDPGATLLLPGINLPLVEGILAVIILAVFHELGHAALSLFKNIKMHSAGALLFGVIPIGAFVEPDEEAMKKLSKEDHADILAAGSGSNYLLSIFFAGLFFAYSYVGVQFQPISTFLFYSLFLNYIIATVNCLPIFITDGARLFALYVPSLERSLNLTTVIALAINFLPNFL
ncbi:MAG: site-2 protease family protein [Candidatus Anstonellales archaeon]